MTKLRTHLRIPQTWLTHDGSWSLDEKSAESEQVSSSIHPTQDEATDLVCNYVLVCLRPQSSPTRKQNNPSSIQTSFTCIQFGQQMRVYCTSSLRCEILATAAWRRLKPRALNVCCYYVSRLLLLGCSLEVAIEGSSHLRMKTPGNTSYCCCCCSFWCEESKYLYLLLLLLLIMWRILVLSGLVATLLLLLRLALWSRRPPRMHNDAVAVKAQKARWNSWSKLRTTQRPLPPTPHTLLCI